MDDDKEIPKVIRAQLREKLRPKLCGLLDDYETPEDLDSASAILKEFMDIHYTLLAKLPDEDRSIFEQYLATFKLNQAVHIYNNGGWDCIRDRKIANVLGGDALSEMRLFLTFLGEDSDENPDSDPMKEAEALAQKG